MCNEMSRVLKYAVSFVALDLLARRERVPIRA